MHKLPVFTYFDHFYNFGHLGHFDHFGYFVHIGHFDHFGYFGHFDHLKFSMGIMQSNLVGQYVCMKYLCNSLGDYIMYALNKTTLYCSDNP